jgi:hypothetical protein
MKLRNDLNLLAYRTRTHPAECLALEHGWNDELPPLLQGPILHRRRHERRPPAGARQGREAKLSLAVVEQEQGGPPDRIPSMGRGVEERLEHSAERTTEQTACPASEHFHGKSSGSVSSSSRPERL